LETKNIFLRDVLEGLSRSPKWIPCKYLYDARGSRLFDEICTLPEYYPTRTELAILALKVPQMARGIGPSARIVELGAGSGEKTHLLLEALDEPAAYLPIDISKTALEAGARRAASNFEQLEVLPVLADYTEPVDLPEPTCPWQTTVAYFPGSTIGNFEPEQAGRFLERIAAMVGDGGGLLIGVDLVKDRAILERAYNDEAGVTAAFNLNLLERINRELGADFDVDGFKHRAVWNDAASRIEMHLVSTHDQRVELAGHTIGFEAGEHIVTEHSYKYEPDDFEQLAARAGFEPRSVWTDTKAWFSVWYLEA
jgi:dimethylhistidine N-methyltransferase